MTIDDRLTRAGSQFRDTHTEPADVRLDVPPAARPRPRPPRRRLVAVGSTVLALAAVTAGVVVWLGASRPTPDRNPAGPPATATDPATDLATGTWLLVAVDTGAATQLRPVTHYTLTVADTGGQQELHLDDDCNVTRIPIVLGPDTIRVTGDALTSLVGCTRPDDPAVTALQPVLGADPITWSASGTDLTLSAAGITLRFTRPAPAPPSTAAALLPGTSWQLVGAVDNTGRLPLTPPPAGSTELRFDAAGRLSAGDGCNTRSAAYTLDGRTLEIGPNSTTDVDCADALELQHAVGAMFAPGSAAWTLTDGRLTLERGFLVLTYDLVGAG